MSRTQFIYIARTRDVYTAALLAASCGIPLAVSQLWLRTGGRHAN